MIQRLAPLISKIIQPKARHWTSRKFTLAILVLGLVVVIYFINIPLGIVFASSASFLLEMFRQLLVFIGGAFGLWVFGQSAVDWKHSSQSQSIQRTESITVDEKIVREFAERYQADPSYRPLETLEGRE